mmetsp:Transcript_108087/g.209250  ORF Transcript_108087/g.209250 Transcript_108087/m.209250 type:complete len:386 (-) Transcript_108087:99-1256(-)
MGHTGWRVDDKKEVVLCLHSVHNVQHSPNESYYGMATDHSLDVEIPVTSERPARLTASLESVISVRIFLHSRGAPSTNDRPVGQLSIPIGEMIDLCGPGVYQTWFTLEDAQPYIMVRGQIVERFRRALHGVSMELHAPRICLTMLESSSEPTEWAKEERNRITYYGPLLVSHVQHLQTVQAYFDRADKIATGGSSEAASTKGELERLKLQQQQDEEVGQLQRELDQITDEANKRIEKGNAAIVKLKGELKHLRDVEAAQLQRERQEAESQLQTLRQESIQLQQRAENSVVDANGNEELLKLRQDVLVLNNQKAALMKMVQEIYGTAQTQTPAQVAAAAALATIGGGADTTGGNAATEQPARVAQPATGNLLPDAHELLSEPLRPL